MIVLSLFDGISCARVALEKLGLPIDKYYASEVDKYAIQINQKNFPDTIQLGDITQITGGIYDLMEAYNELNRYNNIQDILPKWEMLYWLDQGFSFSAKIRTQKQNADPPESTTIQCIEEVWFSKCEVGDIIKTQDPERSRDNGKRNDCTIQESIIQCGSWWYVCRSHTRDKEEDIRRIVGKASIQRDKRKDKAGNTEPVCQQGIQAGIIKKNQGNNVETRDPNKISGRTEDKEECLDKEKVTIIHSEHRLDMFVGRIQVLCGGSPCQDLSIANNKRKGLDGSRSGLFWHYVRLVEELEPKYFVLENVASMPKESKDIISAAMKVRSIMINASLVSAQNRKRLFWTNIVGVTLPKDRHIYLKDILEDEVGERFILKPSSYERLIYRGVTHTSQTQIWDDYNRKGFNEKCPTLTLPHHNTLRVVSPSGYVIENRHNNQSQMDRVYDDEGKSPPLLCAMVPMIKEPTKKGFKELEEGQGIDLAFQTSETHRGRVNDKSFTLTCASCAGTFQNGYIRKLTPIECERLQGLPDNYTEGVSETQRYKCLGNAFHVDVVAHILSFMNGEVKYDYSEQTRLFE